MRQKASVYLSSYRGSHGLSKAASKEKKCFKKDIEVFWYDVSYPSQTSLEDVARSNGDWMPTTMNLDQQTMKN